MHSEVARDFGAYIHKAAVYYNTGVLYTIPPSIRGQFSSIYILDYSSCIQLDACRLHCREPLHVLIARRAAGRLPQLMHEANSYIYTGSLKKGCVAIKS